MLLNIIANNIHLLERRITMFQIDVRNRKPLYEQIVENYKEQIINKVLKTDDKMPSVRDLAKELTINPNTIQKAYRELEYQGYIYSVKGRGTFISGDFQDTFDTEKANLLKETIKSSILELLFMGLPEEDVKLYFKEILSSWKGGKNND